MRIVTHFIKAQLATVTHKLAVYIWRVNPASVQAKQPVFNIAPLFTEGHMPISPEYLLQPILNIAFITGVYM